MRILFVSGTTVGGSGRSQRELAAQLVRRGHDLRFLVDDGRPAPATRWLYGHLSDLSVRLSTSPLERIAVVARDGLGRRVSPSLLDGLPHLGTALPQNALPAALRGFRPDVVVANSVERWAWRLTQQTCAHEAIPTVLYVREESSLPHVDTGCLPEGLVANTPSLANALTARGYPCACVPSVVDTSVTHTASIRRVALSINPSLIKGGDLVWKMASRLPEIPFVLQEAWPLTDAEMAEISTRLALVPNVEFRRATPPGPALYRDARVLLAPYRVDSRPRVILEAQANGIPVVAGDVPALAEAVGAGGLVVPLEDVDAWTAALLGLWSDDRLYEDLANAARAQSHRPEVDPDSLARRFERLLEAAIAGRRG